MFDFHLLRREKCSQCIWEETNMPSLHQFLSSMHLRKLQHFVAVATYESFSKAADAIHLSQPALTRSIQSLEEDLGVRLIDRSPRRIRLTREGRLCIAEAKQIVAIATDMHRVLTKPEMMDVSIGLTSVSAASFGPQIIRSLAAAFPRQHVHLEVGAPEQLHPLLMEGRIDALLTNVDALPNVTGLRCERIASFRRGFFARKDHPIRAQGKVDFAGLTSWPLAAAFPLPDPVWRLLKSTYNVASLDRSFQVRSNHCGLLELMQGGDAIVFSSSLPVMDALEAGTIVELPIEPKCRSMMALELVRKAASPASPMIAEIYSIIELRIQGWSKSIESGRITL
jgi:DNA-binding transcriptional LysR family regulator